MDVVGCAKRTFETIPAKKLRIFPPLVSMLRKIYERLETALSVTHVCVKTLKAQADDHDIDVALCLECCVEQVIAMRWSISRSCSKGLRHEIENTRVKQQPQLPLI